MTKEIASKIAKIGNAYWVDRNPIVTKWEGEFITDMGKRYERFGEKTLVSEKQAAIIDRIAAKLA